MCSTSYIWLHFFSQTYRPPSPVFVPARWLLASPSCHSVWQLSWGHHEGQSEKDNIHCILITYIHHFISSDIIYSALFRAPPNSCGLCLSPEPNNRLFSHFETNPCWLTLPLVQRNFTVNHKLLSSSFRHPHTSSASQRWLIMIDASTCTVLQGVHFINPSLDWCAVCQPGSLFWSLCLHINTRLKNRERVMTGTEKSAADTQ